MNRRTKYDIEMIYELYYHDVYRYVALLNFNLSHVEDIVQNTFLKAMNGIDKFRNDSNIKTWLFTIARNESIRYSKKNLPVSSIDELPELANLINIEDIYCNKDIALQILEYINKCNEPKRSLLALHLIEEMSFVEIGRILEKSDTWCRVTFMRAKNEILVNLKM